MTRQREKVDQQINDFLEICDSDFLTSFFYDLIPIIELYDIQVDNDWVKDAVGEENERTVRLIRTVYLMSRLASFHSPKLATLNIQFKDLWKRMERSGAVEIE